MVVFTCNHCGDTLHKPKVEKHYQFQCRNYKSVTCVDCLKDFSNEEYATHTKCITEDERYAAKGTYKNGIVKKGDVKQDSWLEMIKSICETEKDLKPPIRNLLNTISECSNVPRKKVKFLNFIKSSSGNRANIKDVEEVWDIIEKYKSKRAPGGQNFGKNYSEKKTQENEDNAKVKKRSNENADNNDQSPKKKKVSEKVIQKKSEVENITADKSEGAPKTKKNKQKPDDGNTKESESTKFDYKAKIIEILTEKQSISQKKLQKKILRAYLNTTGQSACEEKIIKKLNKKLKKLPNVGIEDDRILLKA